jgi:hypothetical protein
MSEHDLPPDDGSGYVTGTAYNRAVAHYEAEVDRLREALQWIADHEHDEHAIAERSVCPNDFHTTRMPAEDAWCPDCFSRWWATDGSLPSAEGNYAMGAVAREALEAGER